MTGHHHRPQYPERAAHPTIMMVTNDQRLLKLLDMAMRLELSSDTLPFASGRSAYESAQHATPDLVILDDQLVDLQARDLADRLHRLPRLEQVPTLIINTATASLSQSTCYPLFFLKMRWTLDELYAAVYQLLRSTA